jgi:GT2 family glycosyltransferase
MTHPQVSVIILHKNGKDLLKSSLGSLRKQSYKNLEVIVVDNGSSDDSVEFIRQNFPGTNVICNPENFGFAKANNIGFSQAKGEYLFFLNNDTEVEQGCIEKLVATAERADKHVGLFSPKILSYYKRDIIDNVGHLIYKDGLNRGRGRLEKDSGQYDRVEEICFVSGCACFCRRQVVDDIGGYDEDFFCYGDDADFGLRARLAGWQALLVPQAVVYHMYSATAGKYSPQKAFLVERNRFWVAVKIFPLSLLMLNCYYAMKRYLYQFYSVIVKKGSAGKFVEEFSKWHLVLVLCRAWLGALWGLPKMLKKRVTIQKSKKISNKEILGWFDKYGISLKELALKE